MNVECRGCRCKECARTKRSLFSLQHRPSALSRKRERCQATTAAKGGVGRCQMSDGTTRFVRFHALAGQNVRRNKLPVSRSFAEFIQQGRRVSGDPLYCAPRLAYRLVPSRGEAVQSVFKIGTVRLVVVLPRCSAGSLSLVRCKKPTKQ